MQVPLLDLKAQYRSIKNEIDEAIFRVVESQHFILGQEVEQLENALAHYLGCKYAIGVSSGTDALLVALMALDIQPGDEVIVPDYSFFATAGVVARLQAIPVFVDIDPLTFNIDPEKIRSRITKKTKAIMPVHLFGQSAAMTEIMAIAKEFDLKVVEDAAQAIGTQYKDGKKVGTIGDIGCFSFFPSKNLGAFGDAGLVTINDHELAEKLKILRVHGAKPKYHHKYIGGNFRIDALQAAVLNVKLKYLDQWSAKRRKNAELYSKLFIEAGLAEIEGKTAFDTKNKILLPKAIYKDNGHPNYHIYNQYVIRIENRDEVQKHLLGSGIGCEVYYPAPLYKQECFEYLKADHNEFTNSKAASVQSLALPIYPEMEDSLIKAVIDKCKSVIAA
ncbi:DegT/DnrJ/EryC1/StrS family aminotransferase [bacterium]|nr:DegT/DnrJ/EryC1/StrS family aminotransferase [bacterium]